MKSILGKRLLALTSRLDIKNNYWSLRKLHLLVVTQFIGGYDSHRVGYTHKMVLRDQHGKLFFITFDRYEEIHESQNLFDVAQVELTSGNSIRYAPSGVKGLNENINQLAYLHASRCASDDINRMWTNTVLFDGAYRLGHEAIYDSEEDVFQIPATGLSFQGKKLFKWSYENGLNLTITKER